jgi:hypothetical protein
MAKIAIKDANGSATDFTPASDCIGAPSDTAASSDTGPFSLIALTKRFIGYLASLAAEDFATQTTLAALNTKIPASPATEGGNLATLVARTPALGALTKAGSTSVTIATDQGAIPVSLASAPTTAVTGTFWQSTQPVSLASAPTTAVTGTFWQSTQPVSIATAPVLVAGSAIIGKTGVDQTTDGTTNKVASAGLPTTAAINAASVGLATGLTVLNIKASAGSVYGMAIANKTAAALYIQFYNTAGTPTLGTSVTWWVPVLASQQIFIPVGDIALANHTTGIGIGASTTPTSTGTPGTAPDVVVFYK